MLNAKKCVLDVKIIFSLYILLNLQTAGELIYSKKSNEDSIGSFRSRLRKARHTVESKLKHIYATWDINHFPSFLKSFSLSKISWNVLRGKFRRKIIYAAKTGRKQNFTICYGGSSVTAGHDSPFNKSFAVLTGPLMSSSFSNLNLKLNVRIVAMGNNPCLPYDTCVSTFCGDDPDIIHWEQTYFCGFNSKHIATIEKFIRQSMLLPSHPVVVFSDSATPNWYFISLLSHS